MAVPIRREKQPFKCMRRTKKTHKEYFSTPGLVIAEMLPLQMWKTGEEHSSYCKDSCIDQQPWEDLWITGPNQSKMIRQKWSWWNIYSPLAPSLVFILCHTFPLAKSSWKPNISIPTGMVLNKKFRFPRLKSHWRTDLKHLRDYWPKSIESCLVCSKWCKY